jgi:hypothetical protein
MCGESMLLINIIIRSLFEKVALSKFIVTVTGHKPIEAGQVLFYI